MEIPGNLFGTIWAISQKFEWKKNCKDMKVGGCISCVSIKNKGKWYSSYSNPTSLFIHSNILLSLIW